MGNQNEIDIVALNEIEKTVIFSEVKRKKENISMNVLQEKAKNLQAQLKGYEAQFKGLSMEDM